MLDAAKKKAASRRLQNIELQVALADDFDFKETFGLDRPFDVIYFSYSISMIPPWKQAITMALQNLRPGGALYIVDFYDQKNLPSWFRVMLKRWLQQFHVRFWVDLLPYLQHLDNQNIGILDITPVARRYAFIARFQKS
jgi:S-adenosylmethionine-diacylgycerolhomoserine-N-methlytransferase